MPNPLTALDPIFKRDEADILFIAGTVALVAFEIIDWPKRSAHARFPRDGPKPLENYPSGSRSGRGSTVTTLAAPSLSSTGRQQSCLGTSQASSETTYSA